MITIGITFWTVAAIATMATTLVAGYLWFDRLAIEPTIDRVRTHGR
jgi:hypothetical protein